MSENLEIQSSPVAPPFIEFPPIPRLRKPVVVTEKLDGTNAQVHITEDGKMFAGSRSRWITPLADNYGFARWVAEHRDELLALGPGSHFGEWWGAGIQRKYGLTEKRFSLFNVGRWIKNEADRVDEKQIIAPVCCDIVPVLHRGESLDTQALHAIMSELQQTGSRAAPGFTNPEGIVVYHEAARVLFKWTFEDAHKGKK